MPDLDRQPPEGYFLDSWGDVACTPGLREYPVHCQRHSDHYFCDVCEGYYGVPHDDIHTGSNAHPKWGTEDCACRVCKIHHGKAS